MHGGRLWRLGGVAIALLASLLISCAASPAANKPLRSPSLDYPPPPAQTSDGRTVGADGRSPADTLKMGPTNEGPAPGWRNEEGTYDPNDRVGGQTEHDTKSDVHHHHADDEHSDEPNSDDARDGKAENGPSKAAPR